MSEAVAIPPPPPSTSEAREAFDTWITSAAAIAGCSAVASRARYADVDALLRSRVPIILRLRNGDSYHIIGMIGGRSVSLATPSGALQQIGVNRARAMLCHEADEAAAPTVEQFLADSGLRGRKLDRARRALHLRHSGQQLIADVWILLPSAAKSFWGELWRSGVGIKIASYIGAYALHYFAVLGAWAVVGMWALQGSFAVGWFAEWLLLLATVVVLFAYCRWAQGMMSVQINAVLKERLLEGALRYDRDRLRAEGPSHLLGRVLESNTIQTAMIEGVFGASVATMEAFFAAGVLLLGAVGRAHALLFALWVATVAAVHWVGYRRRAHWTRQRVGLTHDLVEKMVGYRTRVIQQEPTRRHEGEDEALCHYHDAARSSDQAMIAVEMVSARAWIIAATAMLIPAILAGASAVAVALAIGGILLAESALVRFLVAGTALAEGVVAWRNVRDVLHAAQISEVSGTPLSVSSSGSDSAPVLACHDVVYRHHGRSAAAVDGCTLAIRRGERVLIQGDSGSGKSTLCALLTGARQPHSGVVLLYGLDHRTVGSYVWRRRVASTLQFHENHVLTESFAFNLLMGRRWPPTADDLREARAVCEELGLGDLLARMPGGLFQVIGDYGWQLSHGERSRLFIARALLQEASVMVLDESFGALDPAAFEQALQCVLGRASTLIVVAHP